MSLALLCLGPAECVVRNLSNVRGPAAIPVRTRYGFDAVRAPPGGGRRS
ncbi:hypothetical protein ACFRR7_01165 [Streptomyces sp. NPDC056909]